MSNPPPPVPSSPPPPPASHPQSRQQTWIVVAAIVAIVGVIFGVAFYLLFLRSDNEDNSTSEPTSSESTASPEVSDAPSATPIEPDSSASAETPEEPDDIFAQLAKVPDNAITDYAMTSDTLMFIFVSSAFTTPSKNILCYFASANDVVFEPHSLHCDMAEAPDVRPEDIEDSPQAYDLNFLGGTLDITSTNVVYGAWRGGPNALTNCIHAPNPDMCRDLPLVRDLPYGQAIRHGDIACLSEESGLTCVSLSQGKGVWVNRADYGYIFR
ncbi:MAG: hypothetical protein Q4P71_06475 [Actinomycetaceae bacterium]|nr:hypothetical protein [Actinomycetaceae bacterium]